MTFDEKVKFLRNLPLFKVVPISDVRAVAFAVKETENPEKNLVLGKNEGKYLILTPDDIDKITREYPDLASKLI